MPEAMGIERMARQLLFLKGYNAETNVPYLILDPEEYGDETLSDGEVEQIVGGTISDLKDELKSRNLARREYEKLLQAERENENRKTAKEELARRANLTGKNSDIDVLAIDEDDKIIAVECKAEGEPFLYKEYGFGHLTNVPENSGDYRGALANFVNQIGYIRDSEFKYLNKEEYRDTNDALEVDEYWMVVKGGYEYQDQNFFAPDLQNKTEEVKKFKEDVAQELGTEPDKIVLKNSMQILMEIFEEVQKDMGKKRERYSSPLLEAFRHISASADTEEELEYLFSKMEELCNSDIDKIKINYNI